MLSKTMEVGGGTEQLKLDEATSKSYRIGCTFRITYYLFSSLHVP